MRRNITICFSIAVAVLNLGFAVKAQSSEGTEDLGIFVLPSMVEKVEQGNIELVPAISELTGGKIDKNAKKSDCLDWLEKEQAKVACTNCAAHANAGFKRT
jgi:hypothetical protein